MSHKTSTPILARLVRDANKWIDMQTDRQIDHSSKSTRQTADSKLAIHSIRKNALKIDSTTFSLTYFFFIRINIVKLNLLLPWVIEYDFYFINFLCWKVRQKIIMLCQSYKLLVSLSISITSFFGNDFITIHKIINLICISKLK